ncbi:hypothetical protein LLEC1_03997 [Akanthomyces lecanii]|uniref:Uncharacterized protein n=1 Tax=Cordyceps confragosa TaxID=2714763 RepID=A0A179IDP4_CORDF|nr:hypothetical protein LLEC1_03997 [Akanthomyces lecanii]
MTYARDRLPEQLVAAIDSDNVEGVEAIYASAEDESQQAGLLEGIAERAIQKSQLDIIDWVFGTKAFRVAPDSLNNEIYHQACFAHSLDVWKALVRNGFDLDAHHSEFVGDALSLEAYHGNVDIVRFVLENGQDPNKAWGYDDQEPALLAMTGEKPSLEIIRLMLRHGWKQRDSTALIAAAELGNLEAVQLLVENGADLEHVEQWWFTHTNVDEDEWGTALYRAAFKGQAEPVSYLLEKGASTAFRDKKGRSALWAAKQGGNEKVVELLKGAGLEACG